MAFFELNVMLDRNIIFIVSISGGIASRGRDRGLGRETGGTIL